MSDELNVWRDACFAYGGASIEGAELEPSAAAVIRDYGDERHAAGYRAAIADVVEWINSGAGPYVEGYGEEIANEITRLTEALRLQMEAKHKEAAESKLWFQKAQEWKEALRAAEEREKALREALKRGHELVASVAKELP